jgi:hypothetical protein
MTRATAVTRRPAYEYTVIRFFLTSSPYIVWLLGDHNS